ncbi:MAG: glycosyltransferase [Campylobacterota bacterium]
MSLSIIISNRVTKFSGNIIKGIGYIFHFLFPKTRFSIPKNSAPLIKSTKNQEIPKIFWQTNYSNAVSLPMYINYLFNRLMSLDYEYRYASDDDILDFFQSHTSQEEFEAYQKLNDGAAKADFWRLAVLYHIGGVYLDIDASFVWPLSKQIREDDKEIFILNKQHYTNYFMATAPGNEVYKKAIDIIVENIQKKKTEGGTYLLTGPNVINLAIGDKEVNSRFYRYVCVQGAFTNEHFHYIDKKQGKWIHTKIDELIKD